MIFISQSQGCISIVWPIKSLTLLKVKQWRHAFFLFRKWVIFFGSTQFSVSLFSLIHTLDSFITSWVRCCWETQSSVVWVMHGWGYFSGGKGRYSYLQHLPYLYHWLRSIAWLSWQSLSRQATRSNTITLCLYCLLIIQIIIWLDWTELCCIFLYSLLLTSFLLHSTGCCRFWLRRERSLSLALQWHTHDRSAVSNLQQVSRVC